MVSERQKKRQVEQVEEGMQELRERLELAQRRLEAEREADALRRQQVTGGATLPPHVISS